MWCDDCAVHHDMPECPWDWPGVERKEDEAEAKANRLPRCRHCGNPLWCGQTGRHHTCAKENE